MLGEQPPSRDENAVAVGAGVGAWAEISLFGHGSNRSVAAGLARLFSVQNGGSGRAPSRKPWPVTAS